MGLMVQISQHLQRRCRGEDRRVEVARISKGDGDPHPAARKELPGGGSQVEYQFNRLAGRDWLRMALQVIAPWEAEIVERGRTHEAVRCPELALSDVG